MCCQFVNCKTTYSFKITGVKWQLMIQGYSICFWYPLLFMNKGDVENDQ